MTTVANTGKAELIPAGCGDLYAKLLYYDSQESLAGRLRRRAFSWAREDPSDSRAFVCLELGPESVAALALGEQDASGRYAFLGMWLAELEAGSFTLRRIQAADARLLTGTPALAGQTAMDAAADPDQGRGPEVLEMEVDAGPDYCIRWRPAGRLMDLIRWEDE